MVFLVTNSIKKKLVQIFQDILLNHPIFEKTKVYTKFPEEERPKTAVIVRSVSGGSQKLSLDNLMGIHRGFCTLANLKGTYGNSIEWVKDDQENLKNLSPHGFYIIRIMSKEEKTNNFSFVIDPYLICDDEVLNIIYIKEKEGAILKNKPINLDSEIIYSQSHRFEFKKHIDYSIDYLTGEVLFASSVKKYEPILIDYQVCSNQLGPFSTEYYSVNNTSIPGVVLAFGDRIKIGDEQVILIEKIDRPVSKVFGGRWLLDIDVIAVSQDPDQQERLLDYISTSLWAEYQDDLANEGIAIRDFMLSGEGEDLEIEVPEEYSFSAGLSFSVEVDWEVHKPLISEVRRVNYGYGEESFKDDLNYLDEQTYEQNQYDKRMFLSNHQKGLQITPSFDAYQTTPDLWHRITRKYSD